MASSITLSSWRVAKGLDSVPRNLCNRSPSVRDETDQKESDRRKCTRVIVPAIAAF